MSLEDTPLEPTGNADQIWFAPLAMLIAWLAHFFEQVAKLKRVRRNTTFKPNWRDHWAGLRESEWHRDQMLAAGAAQILAGKELDLSDYQLIIEPPAGYGGPCPRTPFEMNRRFLALTRWLADPEAAIRNYAARIARREGVDLSNPLAAHGSTDARLCCAAHHDDCGCCESRTLLTLMVSSAPCARPSNHEGQQRAPPGATDRARGPPTPTTIQTPPTSHAPRARPHLRATLTFPAISTTYPPTLGAHAHEAVEARLISRVVSTPASVAPSFRVPCHPTSRLIASQPTRRAPASSSKISRSPSAPSASGSSAAMVRASRHCSR